MLQQADGSRGIIWWCGEVEEKRGRCMQERVFLS